MKKLTLFVMILASSLLVGCISTVIPPHVNPSAPSFDGSSVNSGLVGFTNGQAIITSHAHDRYNALMGIYGKAWVPAVKPDDGITPYGQNYLIDKQHLFYFSTANRWRKEGKALP